MVLGPGVRARRCGTSGGRGSQRTILTLISTLEGSRSGSTSRGMRLRTRGYIDRRQSTNVCGFSLLLSSPFYLSLLVVPLRVRD